jgi:DNA-directed RNA polymerase subunit RPC12/RpoP
VAVLVKSTRTVVCPTCSGDGNRPDEPMYACYTCKGQGHVEEDIVQEPILPWPALVDDAPLIAPPYLSPEE